MTSETLWFFNCLTLRRAVILSKCACIRGLRVNFVFLVIWVYLWHLVLGFWHCVSASCASSVFI